MYIHLSVHLSINTYIHTYTRIELYSGISCASQVAVLARAINSNVVKRDLTGGGLPWPDGPKGGPRHNSTEANVVFRGKPAGLYMRTHALPAMDGPPPSTPEAATLYSCMDGRRHRLL